MHINDFHFLIFAQVSSSLSNTDTEDIVVYWLTYQITKLLIYFMIYSLSIKLSPSGSTTKELVIKKKGFDFLKLISIVKR